MELKQRYFCLKKKNKGKESGIKSGALATWSTTVYSSIIYTACHVAEWQARFSRREEKTKDLSQQVQISFPAWQEMSVTFS